jgi:hypothetical protein
VEQHKRFIETLTGERTAAEQRIAETKAALRGHEDTLGAAQRLREVCTLFVFGRQRDRER